MTFTEQTLEHALIELFQSEGYTHVNGTYVHRVFKEVFEQAENFRKYRG